MGRHQRERLVSKRTRERGQWEDRTRTTQRGKEEGTDGQRQKEAAGGGERTSSGKDKHEVGREVACPYRVELLYAKNEGRKTPIDRPHFLHVAFRKALHCVAPFVP